MKVKICGKSPFFDKIKYFKFSKPQTIKIVTLNNNKKAGDEYICQKKEVQEARL